MCNYCNILHIVLCFQRQGFTIQSSTILKELVIMCFQNPSSLACCMAEGECVSLDDQVLKFCEATSPIIAFFYRAWWNSMAFHLGAC